MTPANWSSLTKFRRSSRGLFFPSHTAVVLFALALHAYVRFGKRIVKKMRRETTAPKPTPKDARCAIPGELQDAIAQIANEGNSPLEWQSLANVIVASFLEQMQGPLDWRPEGNRVARVFAEQPDQRRRLLSIKTDEKRIRYVYAWMQGDDEVMAALLWEAEQPGEGLRQTASPTSSTPAIVFTIDGAGECLFCEEICTRFMVNGRLSHTTGHLPYCTNLGGLVIPRFLA